MKIKAIIAIITFTFVGFANAANQGNGTIIDDANEVLCRLEIRQVQKTLVDASAKNVFYIVQGNESTSDELLRQTAQQIIDLTTEYSGGEGNIIVPEIV